MVQYPRAPEPSAGRRWQRPGRSRSPSRRSLGRWFENQLREIVEPLLPMLEVVGVVIHVPDVRDGLFLQVGVNTLANTDQAVFVAARDVEKFQLLGRLLRVGHEFRSRLGVGRGGEASDPRERVEISQANVQ